MMSKFAKQISMYVLVHAAVLALGAVYTTIRRKQRAARISGAGA